MPQFWIIALFMVIALADARREPLAPEMFSDRTLVLLMAASVAAWGLLLWASAWRVCRDLDRRGNGRGIETHDLAVTISRWWMVVQQAVLVIGLGWLGVVRKYLGDWIVVDELVSILPPLSVGVFGWWSQYPIERRLMEASFVRALDEGSGVRAPQSLRGHLVTKLRHHVLAWATPLLLILSWSEWVERVVTSWKWVAAALPDASTRQAVLGLVQIVGAVSILVAAPIFLRLAWDTVRMPAGPLRERLVALCRHHRVRVREILVWRTGGTMINGAVVGLVPGLRYILLTDSLIESMEDEEIEAVMAHEVSHLKNRHVPWLAAATIVPVMTMLIVVGTVLQLLGLVGRDPSSASVAELVMVACALVTGMLVMGFVSRRFEWQCDAFAVKHLSDADRPKVEGPTDLYYAPPPQSPIAAPMIAPGVPDRRLRPDAARAMASALDTVARLNHVPRRKFSFRHGSIAERQRRIGSLVGQFPANLPIDRTVRWTKRTIAVVGFMVFLFVGAAFLLGSA